MRVALALHVSAMRGKCCTTRSVRALQDDVEEHLRDWLARPLVSLAPHEVVTRHQFLVDTASSYLANRVLYQLRALYRTAQSYDGILPPDLPAFAVVCTSANRRREPIPWRALPEWRVKVETLRNPVRRDLQLFLLYSGLRSCDAQTLRWSNVNFESCALDRGGAGTDSRRTIGTPLTSELLLLLLRRRRQNAAFLGEHDRGWVFPARRRSGAITHVQEANQKRVLNGKQVRALPAPYRLRDTFIRAAHEAGVGLLDQRMLLNDDVPALDSEVEVGALPNFEQLQTSAESVVNFLNQRQAVPC